MLNHFDIIAPLYDRLIRLNIDLQLLNILELPKNGRLLDAGGGTGRVSGRLTEYVDQIVVCDFSQRMLRQSKRKTGLQPVRADVTNLPFPDGSMDRILVVDALHHFRNPAASILELSRVLKQGGRLVIEEFNISHWAVKLIAWGEKLALMGSHFFKPDEIAELIAAAGLAPRVTTNGHTTVWVSGEKLNHGSCGKVPPG